MLPASLPTRERQRQETRTLLLQVAQAKIAVAARRRDAQPMLDLLIEGAAT